MNTTIYNTWSVIMTKRFGPSEGVLFGNERVSEVDEHP